MKLGASSPGTAPQLTNDSHTSGNSGGESNAGNSHGIADYGLWPHPGAAAPGAAAAAAISNVLPPNHPYLQVREVKENSFM